MVINLLKYQPTVITSIQLNGIVIDRVSSYKLLRSAVMAVGHVIKCGGITAKRYKQLLSCSNYCWDCPTCMGNLIEQDPANDNPL